MTPPLNTADLCGTPARIGGRNNKPSTPGENDVSDMPIPMLLWCPSCSERHIDKGEFETKPHHTHACQFCGMVWRPAIQPTCGVMFLPGFKDQSP